MDAAVEQPNMVAESAVEGDDQQRGAFTVEGEGKHDPRMLDEATVNEESMRLDAPSKSEQVAVNSQVVDSADTNAVAVLPDQSSLKRMEDAAHDGQVRQDPTPESSASETELPIDQSHTMLSYARPQSISSSVAQHQSVLHTFIPGLYDLPAVSFSDDEDEYADKPGVDPAQMTNPNYDAVQTDYFQDALVPTLPDTDSPRIQAFAKLEFDDGQFYMTTYSVELGRDIRAARYAENKRLEASQTPDDKSRSKSSSGGDIHTPSKSKWGGSGKIANSIVSESGGIMGVDYHDQGGGKRKRKKSKKSKSTSSSSSAKPTLYTDYNTLASAPLPDSTSGSHPLDPTSLLPSPNYCPLIPIHPPSDGFNGAVGHRGISRKHVKIAFNFEKNYFEMEIKGRNGAFIDEKYYHKGALVRLTSGSQIQIGGVKFRFVLPNAPNGDTGSDNGVDDGDDGEDLAIGILTSEDGSNSSHTPSPEIEDEITNKPGKLQNSDKVYIKKEEIDQKISKSKSSSKAKRKRSQSPSVTPSATAIVPSSGTMPGQPGAPPKKRGPGRPPKNGIMSKREEALIKRKLKEEAKRAQLENGLTPAEKEKLAKLAKEGETESLEPKPEKRKYTKRKRPGEPEQNLEGETIPNTEGSIQPPPEKKKPLKPPRSPSPVYNIAELTEEQLSKPQANYVVLIHDALTQAKDERGLDGLSLPQIYRAIERKYPYFKVGVQTLGWQSSVRHNLSQHPAFLKLEREGKGWVWGIDPKVSIEKEKKRRPSPPPMPLQNYFNQRPFMRPPHPYHPHSMYPGAMRTQSMVGAPSPQNSAMGQFSGPTSNIPGIPGNGNYGIGAAPPSTSSSTYTSPYGPPPPVHPITNNIQPTAPPTYPNSYYNPMSYPQAPMQYQPTASMPSNVRSGPVPPQPRPNPSLSPPNNSALMQARHQAIDTFKSAFLSSLDNLPEENKIHAAKILDSALDRVLGMKPDIIMPTEENQQEQQIMDALNKMLKNLETQSNPSNPVTPQPAYAPTPPYHQQYQQQQQQQQQQQHGQQTQTTQPPGYPPTPSHNTPQPPVQAPHQHSTPSQPRRPSLQFSPVPQPQLEPSTNQTNPACIEAPSVITPPTEFPIAEPPLTENPSLSSAVSFHSKPENAPPDAEALTLHPNHTPPSHTPAFTAPSHSQGDAVQASNNNNNNQVTSSTTVPVAPMAPPSIPPSTEQPPSTAPAPSPQSLSSQPPQSAQSMTFSNSSLLLISRKRSIDDAEIAKDIEHEQPQSKKVSANC